jgi:hypothetical protein
MTKHKLNGAWVAHRVAMLKSPAYQMLGLHARRILDRIEIEHMDHAGKDNGRLIVPYDDLIERGGVGRRFIAPALRELVALGFTEIKAGCGGNGEFRAPNVYRLTYLETDRAPTDEWKRITSIREARTVRSQARAGGQKRRTHSRARPVCINAESA